MKMIKTRILLPALLCVLLSCDEFVTVDVPDNQLSGAQVFEDVRTAESVLNHVYTRLHNSVLVSGDAGGITVLLGHYADELNCNNPTLPEMQFNTNTLLGTDNSVQSLWRNSYNLIYVVNSVLEGVGQSASLAQQDRDRLRGEALFSRAYIHFYLNQLFGEIPYVTTTDYRANTRIGKLSDEDIFGLLENDLQQSESLLSENYSSALRVRPNRSTATALLARLYLYNRLWEPARQKASAVIENSALYQWVEDLDSVFLRNSTGTIWQLGSSPEGNNTLDARSFIFITVPPPNRSLETSFINHFEQGDLRKTYWTKGVTNGELTFHHSYKYKRNTTTPASEEYPIQFRLEEMYLIRAEAYAELEMPALARNDLDKIRNRAGLENTSAVSRPELITAVLDERRSEFFCELGHRFFDLKRRALLGDALDGIKPGWEATDALWPLPENELLLNPNLLPQNQGY